MAASDTGEPIELLALCETLKSNADEVATDVLDRWQVIGEAEPWQALPADLDHDHLPALIRSLASAALCTDFDPDLCRELVGDSAEHGTHRAREGMDDALIYREYHLLRRALARRMQEEHGEGATVYYATMRIDALVSLATTAALYGMNRSELEEEGRWPDVLNEMLEEWPLPGT